MVRERSWSNTHRIRVFGFIGIMFDCPKEDWFVNWVTLTKKKSLRTYLLNLLVFTEDIHILTQCLPEVCSLQEINCVNTYVNDPW